MDCSCFSSVWNTLLHWRSMYLIPASNFLSSHKRRASSSAVVVREAWPLVAFTFYRGKRPSKSIFVCLSCSCKSKTFILSVKELRFGDFHDYFYGPINSKSPHVPFFNAKMLLEYSKIYIKLNSQRKTLSLFPFTRTQEKVWRKLTQVSVHAILSQRGLCKVLVN